MTAPDKERDGSFKGKGARDPLLFDPALQRHDRGWPHQPPEPVILETSGRRWRTVGIVHFRDDEGDET